MSPNLKRIVGFVVRIVPDSSKGRLTHRRGRAGQFSILFTHTDEIDKIFNFGNPLRGQRLNFLDQGLGMGIHGPLTSSACLHYPCRRPDAFSVSPISSQLLVGAAGFEPATWSTQNS